MNTASAWIVAGTVAAVFWVALLTGVGILDDTQWLVVAILAVGGFGALMASNEDKGE